MRLEGWVPESFCTQVALVVFPAIPQAVCCFHLSGSVSAHKERPTHGTPSETPGQAQGEVWQLPVG